ncbi:nuclease A inhibitor family protein [Hymenobacter sp. B81]|uniref:nuclease A inhibitor family protein n=1 Tax=Hymenobacter sp. B81 TaxID=3344878 RepID=UPI0037DD9067
MPSIFSRIVSGELPAFKVAEDERHLAFLDITPLVEGHTLVIPKREVDYIFDLPADELAALHQFAQRVAQGLKEAVTCKRIGVAVIGLEVPHAHIHLIPMNRVSDMNFANPKIKVEEARMRELAEAIAAQVPGAEGQPAERPAPAPAGGSAEAANDPAVTALREMSAGLTYMSETDSPLTVVSYPAPAGNFTNGALLKLLGQPADTAVETQELTYFLRNHTADDGVLGNPELANRFKALQMYLKQELEDTKVYRVGQGPELQAYVLGKTSAGNLVGFQVTLVET